MVHPVGFHYKDVSKCTFKKKYFNNPETLRHDGMQYEILPVDGHFPGCAIAFSNVWDKCAASIFRVNKLLTRWMLPIMQEGYKDCEQWDPRNKRWCRSCAEPLQTLDCQWHGTWRHIPESNILFILTYPTKHLGVRSSAVG
jgi:hypothetical protein